MDKAIIGADGRVRGSRVLRSIPLLDQAALDAVREWRYTPPTLNGAPIEVIMTATVTFALGALVSTMLNCAAPPASATS